MILIFFVCINSRQNMIQQYFYLLKLYTVKLKENNNCATIEKN